MTIDFEKTDGLIPAIVQDATQRDVLMVAYMNRSALEKTLATGYVTFYSRSRQKLWTKGETSGNRLRLVRLSKDLEFISVRQYGFAAERVNEVGKLLGGWIKSTAR